MSTASGRGDHQRRQPAKYRLQSRESDGVYRNPFKSGGCALRWGKWVTRSEHTTREAAEAAWLALQVNGLAQKRVVLRGQWVVDQHGRRLDESGQYVVGRL